MGGLKTDIHLDIKRRSGGSETLRHADTTGTNLQWRNVTRVAVVNVVTNLHLDAGMVRTARITPVALTLVANLFDDFLRNSINENTSIKLSERTSNNY